MMSDEMTPEMFGIQTSMDVDLSLDEDMAPLVKKRDDVGANSKGVEVYRPMADPAYDAAVSNILKSSGSSYILYVLFSIVDERGHVDISMSDMSELADTAVDKLEATLHKLEDEHLVCNLKTGTQLSCDLNKDWFKFRKAD